MCTTHKHPKPVRHSVTSQQQLDKQNMLAWPPVHWLCLPSKSLCRTEPLPPPCKDNNSYDRQGRGTSDHMSAYAVD